MTRNGASGYTVDEALMSIGFGKYQALVLGYAGVGWIAEAMEMMLLSFVGPAVQIEWDLSSKEESLISSVVFAGMLLGAYSWGIISDNYGRRVGFLFTALTTCAAGFLSAFAPNYFTLIILRFLVGVGLGGGPVLSSWFLEFIPAPQRGSWMVVLSAFWKVGILLEASLAWAVMPSLGWRWLLVLSSLPSSFLLLFYTLTPESPRYLCMRGQVAEAVQIMENMARMNNKPFPSGKLISDHKIELDDLDSTEAGQLIKSRKHDGITVDTVKSFGVVGVLQKLLSPMLLKSTILLWIVFFGHAFSYYGIVLLTSELSNGNRVCTGLEMQSGHLNHTSLYKEVFITSLAEVPSLILSAVMVDRIGRKLSMSAMLFGGSIFLIPLVLSQSEELTIACLFGARICISGSFTILHIYAPEVYPTSVRSSGIGVASSIGRLGGIICPLVAVALVHGCHQTASVMLFEIVLLLSATAVCLFPLETSGRRLTDSMSNFE